MIPAIQTVAFSDVGLNCITNSTNCVDCVDGNVLVSTGLRNFCAGILTVEKSYFVVSLSTLYIKFQEKLNSDIRLSSFEGILLNSEDDYNAYLAGTLPTSSYIPFTFDEGSYRVYQSHLIFKLNIESTRINEGVMVLKPKSHRFVNSTGEVKFYSQPTIVVTNINYYRAGGSFEGVLGMIVGILLGLNGFLALFIPSVKYTIMTMKVFQMNNYFFLINVNLPINLFLFFDNIQIGNIFKQFERINPLSFMANDTCKEFQEKLLALNKNCQLFKNAGPHMFWFGISGIVKLALEGYQKMREKQGHPRGKLYEFLKLKFGRRYFIELLNYFHMDLVLYNLMNLLFSEMDNFTTFFNLFMSVVLIVFFIYFYIIMFVIVAEYASDFLLTSLCDPLNKLGTIEAVKKKDDDLNPLLGAKTMRYADGRNSKGSITKNQNSPIKSGPNEPPKETDRNPASENRQNEERKHTGWNVKRLFEEVKYKKFKIPKTKEDEEYEMNKDPKLKGVIRMAGTDAKEDATFEPANIYRFLFMNSHCMNTYSTHYYPISIIKEFLLALILVISYSSGVLQSLVFSLIFTLIYINNLTMSPLQNEFNNRLLKIYSFLYMLMSYITFILNIFDDSVRPELLYFFFGYILILLEMGIIGLIITMTISDFIKKRRDLKLLEASKNKVHPTLHTELKSVQVDKTEKGDNQTKKEKTEEIEADELRRPKTAYQSQLSSDSFKKIEYNMPKKDEAGGKFFRTHGEGVAGPGAPGLGTESHSSLASKKSKAGPKGSKGSGLPPMDSRNGRPLPRRVDSATEELDTNTLAPPALRRDPDAESQGSSVSKAKNKKYSKKNK